MNFQIPLELEFKVEFGNMPNPSETRLIMERIFFEELSLSCSFQPSQDFSFQFFASRPKFQEGSPSAMMALWSFCIACSWTYKQPFASKSTWLARRLQSGQKQKLFSLGSFFLWLCKRCERIFLKLVNILVWVFTNKWRSGVQSAISHFATSSRLPYFNRWKYSADWL